MVLIGTLLSDGKACASELWTAEVSLREALLRCSPVSCLGVAFTKEAGSVAEFPETGVHSFVGCGSSADTDSDTSAVLWKDYSTPVPEDTVQLDDFTVNFFGRRHVMDEDAIQGYVNTNSDEFQLWETSGLSYGWHCPKEDRRDGSDPLETPTQCQMNFKYLSNPECTAEESCLRIGDSLTDTCSSDPDVYFNFWRMAVPNGAYEVTLHGMKACEGSCSIGWNQCAVSNTRISDDLTVDDATGIQSFEATQQIEVHNGMLTMRGNPHTSGGDFCLASMLEVSRVGAQIDGEMSWLPEQTDPWYQIELQETQSVSKVCIFC